MARYIICPRCELNFIDADAQEYCDVCVKELSGEKTFSDGFESEEGVEETELCPVCGENYMPLGEKMCEECKKQRQDYEVEEEDDEDEEKEDASWRSYLDDEEEEIDLGIPDSEFDEEEEEEEEEEIEEEKDDFEYVSADDYYDMDDDDDDDDDDDFDSFDDDDAPTPKASRKKKNDDF